MNQLVAFFAPTALPTAAGAAVRAQGGAAMGGEFAAILAQVQNTLAAGGNMTIDPAAQQKVTDLLAQLPPGLVQAFKSLSTEELAAQLQAVAEGTPVTEAPDLAALVGAMTPSAIPAPSVQPANDGSAPAANAEQSLGAFFQTLQQAGGPVAPATTTAPGQPGVTPAQPTSAATAAEAQADPQLRGTIALDEAPQQSAAKATDATAVAKLVENAAAVMPHAVARPRTDSQAAPTQQNKSTPEAHAPGNKRKTAAVPANDTTATLPPQAPNAQGGTKAEAPAIESAPQAQPNVSQAATPNAGAPAKADIAQPTAPAVAPTTSPLPTLIDAQQLSANLSAAPQAGVPVDALAVHIARKFEAGANRFEITLSPAELGRLDISLSVADDGQVQAIVRAERPETLDILQRDARSLEQQLRQAGLEVGSNALSFSLSGGNGQQRQAPFAGWPAFAEARDAAATAKQDAAASYIAVRKSDGIDIRV